MSQEIESKVIIIKDQRVILDSDLAKLYGVSTKRLNEQVRRNLDRFPADFGFQLDPKEIRLLRSQFATSSWGGRRYLPFAFTEHGALMLASVLSSPTAIQASIQVVRAFVRLREILGNHEELARRVSVLEARYDGKFKVVFDAIRQLMKSTPESPDRRIGFHPDP